MCAPPHLVVHDGLKALAGRRYGGRAGGPKAENQLAAEFPRCLEVPFSSSRKMMMTASKISGGTLGDGGVPLPAGTELLAVVKGAPNYIINSCTSWLTPESMEAKLTEEVKASTMAAIDDLSSQAFRVLAVAMKLMPKFPFDENDEEIQSAESGRYNEAGAYLEDTTNTKIYQMKAGLDSDLAALTNLPEGPSFHLALNNTTIFDNRIPPRGATNAELEAVRAEPVGYTYVDGQYWDDTQYDIPPSAKSAVAKPKSAAARG